MKLLLLRSNFWCRFGIARTLSYWVRFYSNSARSPDLTDSLHLRISRSGHPTTSMTTILDQWVEEGRQVKQSELLRFIKQLRKYRRFRHALQVSEWMCDQRNHDLSPGNIAIRLDLISKVHGLELAENYFNSIPECLRVSQVYGALLNCYAHNKSLEKAEVIMEKMKELGFAKTSLPYNLMLNLYFQLGKLEKLDILLQEMEEKGVNFDKFTINIRLNAYGASSDMEGMEKLLLRMEAARNFKMDWNAYVVASKWYLKAGLIDKSLAMLKRSEQLIIGKSKTKQFAYEVLLTSYAASGNKDEVYRIWNLYKKVAKVYNTGYLCMISSLVKLDDIDGAERILKEWESGNPLFDIRIPNIIISGYCRKGLLEKAEAYLNRLIESGKEPEATTLSHLAMGYHVHGQIAKSVETLKRAILASQPGWKPNYFTLAACHEYLRHQGNVEAAEELLKLLEEGGHCLTDIHDKLVCNPKNESLGSQALDEMETGEQIVDRETDENIEPKDEGSI